MVKVEDEAIPNPEFLIKSIAEQGYSLETALADLIDNSISANADKIEILTDTNSPPYTLFIADNGSGMDASALKTSMLFPSDSPEHCRNSNDLGRFGLGMKTASFSQTRKFTVISKVKGTCAYKARTWDVDYLKEKQAWLMQINTEEEIEGLIQRYKSLSNIYMNELSDFEANTIIIWQGLYKFEKYLNMTDSKKALKNEITNITSDYLSLVFHRFMEKKNNNLRIRINNRQLEPFNPFPTNLTDFRAMEYKKKVFGSDQIKIEGFILPSRSIDESKNKGSLWTTSNKGLMDMEGIYIYRADRIILFGGWNGLIPKAPRLQLARLRVEVGNGVDHLLHLNVAKSKVVIPHDLKEGVIKYINELKIEAEREFYNRGIRKFPNKQNGNGLKLFERTVSSKGTLLELNADFPLVANLIESLPSEKKSQFNTLIRMINTAINNIRKTHEDKCFVGVEDNDGISNEDILITVKQLLQAGCSSKLIVNEILPNLGFKISTLPDNILEMLNE